MFLLSLPHTIANVFLFARAILGRAPSAHALRETYVEALIDAQDNHLSRTAGPSACFGERRVVKNDAPLLRDYGEIEFAAQVPCLVEDEHRSGVPLVNQVHEGLLENGPELPTPRSPRDSWQLRLPLGTQPPTPVRDKRTNPQGPTRPMWEGTRPPRPRAALRRQSDGFRAGHCVVGK